MAVLPGSRRHELFSRDRCRGTVETPSTSSFLRADDLSWKEKKNPDEKTTKKPTNTNRNHSTKPTTAEAAWINYDTPGDLLPSFEPRQSDNRIKGRKASADDVCRPIPKPTPKTRRLLSSTLKILLRFENVCCDRVKPPANRQINWPNPTTVQVRF